jgi:predicted HNH restriction endonuclease
MKKLLEEISNQSKVFLKVRKARELDNDLPPETAFTVDNKSWRKLLDMEKKSFKIVESIATLAEKIEKGGVSPNKKGMGENIEEEEEIDEGDIESFVKSLALKQQPV